MREKDLSYKNILLNISNASGYIDEAEGEINNASQSIECAKETLMEIRSLIKIRQDAYVRGDDCRKSLALESVKHLRREAERIEENLRKES